MGYTHYWRTPREMDAERFAAVAADFARLVPELAARGVPLGDSDGTGEPEIGPDFINFNGRSDCGHPHNSEISIPWPARGAGGVAGIYEDATAGEWYAGVLLVARTCNGDCSYENCVIERVRHPQPWSKPDEAGRYGQCCKTAFRPYDIAVTAALLTLKHHMGDAVEVTTDGEDEDWADAKMLCYTVLDYGMAYEVRDGELVCTVKPDPCFTDILREWEQANPHKPPRTEPRYLSCTETAKVIRVALKRHWPRVKFSVTSKGYSGGASVSVSWTDGPTEKQVSAVTGQYSGREFDGGIDMAVHVDHWLLPDGSAIIARNPGTVGSGGDIAPQRCAEPPGAQLVSFGANYVHTNRHYSAAFMQHVGALAAERYGITVEQAVGCFNLSARLDDYNTYEAVRRMFFTTAAP